MTDELIRILETVGVCTLTFLGILVIALISNWVSGSIDGDDP